MASLPQILSKLRLYLCGSEGFTQEHPSPTLLRRRQDWEQCVLSKAEAPGGSDSLTEFMLELGRSTSQKQSGREQSQTVPRSGTQDLPDQGQGPVMQSLGGRKNE